MLQIYDINFIVLKDLERNDSPAYELLNQKISM
jgi:hypothetical protein